MAVLSALKITCLMSKKLVKRGLCYFIEVGASEYLVEFGHVEEFIALFKDWFSTSALVVTGMSYTSRFVDYEYQWYSKIN